MLRYCSIAYVFTEYGCVFAKQKTTCGCRRTSQTNIFPREIYYMY